jgi:methionine--tRNA ligase beta chain
MISFDDFKNIELKVAKVLSVEDHPNADKLLVLKISLGEEERQLVAGIKGHYTAETLVGKSIVIVANLEPATLRGVESQGMLLACEDEGRVMVLTPDGEAAPGSSVR